MAMTDLASVSTYKCLIFSYFISLQFTFSGSTVAVGFKDTAATFAKPRRLVTKLFHYDSVHSPYFNTTGTISDRAKRAMKSSIARFTYLHTANPRSNILMTAGDYRASVIPEDIGLAFLANISIGEPPVVQFMVVDTGSSLLWVQCLPCIRCFEQNSPVFDPSKSSTYVNLACDSPYCNVTPWDKCDLLNNCRYSQRYVDNTTTIGNLATEKLTFETSDEGIIRVPDVVVGCGHDNLVYNGLGSGILGLGPHNISLVSHLGSIFSYCTGNIHDLYYNYNQLIFGNGAIIEGDSTPLELFDDHYYLTLEDISVGEKRLYIDPGTFVRMPSGGGGVVIDTGSTYSWIIKGGFEPLSAEVQSLLDGQLGRVIDPSNPRHLCYGGILKRDLKGFPVVTFHFGGGADLVLDIDSLFMEYGSDQFCMAVLESDDLTLIGMLAQQYYNVGYDLFQNKVSFQRIDCELLDD